MNNRRLFLRTFAGHAGMLLDEFRGIKHIPLSRLKDLPENVIKQIEPVFFPEEKWSVKNKRLLVPQHNQGKGFETELNDIDLMTIAHFKNHTKLKETALKISKGSGLPFNEIYKSVTSLFFLLASLRICHPREEYNFDELILENKQPRRV